MGKLIFISLIFVSIISFAQTSIERQLVGSAGSTQTATNLTMTYSVGEPIISTQELSGSITINQGFQQTKDIATEIEENYFVVDYKAYPNPVVNNLYISLSTDKNSTLNISLVDMQGKVLQNRQINTLENSAEITEFDMSNYESGSYFVNISTQNSKGESIKIVKK